MTMWNQNFLNWSYPSINRYNPIILNDDFTSYADTTAGDLAYPTTATADVRVNPTNDNIDFDMRVETSNNTIIYHDLGVGAISDTQWSIRFDITFSELSATVNSGIHISLTNGTGGYSSNEDALILWIKYTSTTKNYFIESCDGQATNGGTLGTGVSWTPVTSTTYYFELSRLSSTTAKITRYTSSTYLTEADSTITETIASGITGLRYFKMLNVYGLAEGSSMVGTLDNLKVLNGTNTFP